jgi:hypothetical protein
MTPRKAKIDASFTVNSKEDLLNFLKKQNLSLPPYKERTKQHWEKLGIYLLLITWSKTNNLSYPLILNHQDKPDFQLSHGNKNIGIEFTVACDQNTEAIFALAQQEDKPAMVASDEFGPGAPPLTAEQKRQIINRPRRITTPGFGDDGMEKSWCSWIIKTIKDKTNDFEKPEFKKYDENWLLIYDETLVALAKTQTAVNFLLSDIQGYWTQPTHYDRIFIQRYDVLVDIRPDNWQTYPRVGI